MSKWVLSSLFVFLSVFLFGGVDLWSVVIVLGILSLGMKVRPLRADIWPFYLVFGMLVFCLGVLLKELLPADFFGATLWRSSLEADYGLKLAKIHHPEWPLLLRCLLMGLGLGAVIWWWRSFSDTRTLRIHLAWTGFIVAVIVALFSFALRDEAIFKIRTTLGYDGFGPFPNRNHTGALMVIGLFLGWGCGWEALRHRLTLQWVSSFCGCLILAAGLVASNSRGAVAAGLLSLFIVLILVCLHKNDFRFIIVGGAIVLIGVSLASLFGSTLIKRVRMELSPQSAFAGRIEIWKDAIKIIQEAPLVGHGVGMYEKIQPFYQSSGKPNHQIHHPENAYLQLASELGLPLLFLVLGLVILMLIPAWDEMRSHHQFPLRICAFGGILSLAIHGLVDVPFLRWGISVMGALCWVIFTASRLPSHDEPGHSRFRSYLFPLTCSLGLAWIAWSSGLRWGNLDLTRFSTEKIEQQVRLDPLNGEFRHQLGMRWVQKEETRESAYSEFRLSQQLLPTIWTLPVEAARAVQPYSEGIALSFWGRGIERSGHRADEILMVAVKQSRSLPHAALFWKQYVEVHPALIPTYLIQEKPPESMELFTVWKEERGKLKGRALGVDERRNFYELIVALNQKEYWSDWVNRQGDPEDSEKPLWASIFDRLGEAEKAWDWLSKSWSPIVLTGKTDGKEDLLKMESIQNPQNWVNNRRWLEWLAGNGRVEEYDQSLLQIALVPESPLWFKQLAAQRLAEKKKYNEAVRLLMDH